MAGRKLRPPREPAPGECCGSGCTRCVWDVYYDQLAEYEERLSKVTDSTAFTMDEDDDSSSSSSSEDIEEAHRYLGSVVLKYIDEPLGASAISPSAAVSMVLGRSSRIRDVRVLPCIQNNEASLNNDNPIKIIDLVLDSKDNLGTLQPEASPLPGDVVEVFVPNQHDVERNGVAREVEELCHRLRLIPDQWCELHCSPFVPPDNFPPWLPLRRPLQIRTLLAYFVDIGSSSYLLRPTYFQTLARLPIQTNTIETPCIDEKWTATPTFLRQCADPETAPFIYKTIMKNDSTLCYPRLIDMLNVFSFLKVPLERLLELSGPLRPRKYSLVKYKQLQDQSPCVQLCLRGIEVWEEDTPKEENNTTGHVLASFLRASSAHRRPVFTGHVSHSLCHYSSKACTVPMYVGTRLFGTTAFSAVLKKSLVSVKSGSGLGIVLIAAGTGIAPMMNAVDELVQHLCDRNALGNGHFNCWVIYGARNLSELVFHDQLQEALRLTAITRYDVALSRVDLDHQKDCPARHRYVTDVLTSQAKDIRTLLENEGKIFACGPAAVLRSIRERVMEKILGCSDDDESVREQRMMVLESKQQLMFDVWSTANIF